MRAASPSGGIPHVDTGVTERSTSIPVSRIVKDLKKEIGRGLLRAMCKDLGLAPTDL